MFANLNYFNLHFYHTHRPYKRSWNVMIKMKIIWYFCRKAQKNHFKKYNISDTQDFFFFNGNYFICTLNESESLQTGASHSYLDTIYVLMWDNQQFICCFCNCTALKLEANNVNKY